MTQLCVAVLTLVCIASHSLLVSGFQFPSLTNLLSPTGGSKADANSDEYTATELQRTFPLPGPIPGCGLRVATCSASPFRRIDGSCNNLNNPMWGMANSPYSRMLGSRYSDNVRKQRRGINNRSLPGARRIRTSLFPAGSRLNMLLTLMAMEYGQFLAHDMSLQLEPATPPARCCTAARRYQKPYSKMCFPIKIPTDDATMGRANINCLNFTRTMTDRDFGCSSGTTPAKPLNAVTSWIDLSNVYANDDTRSRGLRTLQGGRLITETRNGRIYPPRETDVTANCVCNLASETTCYRTGDPRTNQNAPLTILQIMFHREHNRIAGGLSKINLHWNDERLYQEARRILIAVFQRITYYEWIPELLGGQNAFNGKLVFNTAGFVNDYNSNVFPDIANEHAHAAFRFFHTNIVGILNMMSSTRSTTSTLAMNNWFNRPGILEQGTNIEQLTVGMITQNMEESDNIFVEQITDRMGGCRGDWGTDLRAADFQRDRDHALSYYNEYRVLAGLRSAASFDDYGDLISAQNIGTLKTLYADYRDVDLSVGASLERPLPGSPVGPTFQYILIEQFRRTRQADRYWFENSGSGFTPAQLAEIRKATIARIFCDSGNGVTSIQPKAFSLISSTNNLVSCTNIPSVNLNMWKTTT